MKTERKCQRKAFGIGILILMTMLALGTVVLASNNTWEKSGSYALLIEKTFAEKDDKNVKIPQAVIDAAKKQTYTFRISGTRIDSNHQVVPVNDIITLPVNGEWKTSLYSDGPFQVTVTELTDDVQVSVDNKDYNMTGTQCETNALLQGPQPQKIQLKSNAKITISRPSKVNYGSTERALTTTTWFHIYNEPSPGQDVLLKPMDKYVKLVPGAEAQRFEGLCAGTYTIEELKAPDGYSVLVGPRSEYVSANAEGITQGSFHINGNPGRLTVTAGGTKGDGGTHYYEVSRLRTDDTKFETRMIRLESGESHVIDDLPQGDFTVTEYIYGGKSGYTLTVPQAKKAAKQKTNYSSALTSSATRSWRAFTLSNIVTYVNIIQFGPLCDSSSQPLTDAGTYDAFYYGVSNDAGQVVRMGSHINAPYAGTGKYNVNNPRDLVLNTDKKLHFSVTGVKDPDAKRIRIVWQEYNRNDVKSQFTGNFNTPNTKTVDPTGWMLLSKDADSSPGAETLTYCYTVTGADSSGTALSFANCTVTDENGNPLPDSDDILKIAADEKSAKVSVRSGETIKLNGLKKGTYTIRENVVTNEPKGFQMEVTGCAISITEPDKASDIITHGQRELTISKPACLSGKDDRGRDYTFQITDSNKTAPDNVVGNVTMKAGESKKFMLSDAGTYRLTPTNDMPDPFRMTYTDSSSINGTAQGNPSATIQFSNVFTAGNGGYRYIHEYYLKDDNGNYLYEGSSEMKHVRGRPLNESYQSLDIGQEPDFSVNGQSYLYTYFGAGYGIVDVDSGASSAGAGRSVREETATDDTEETVTEETSDTEETLTEEGPDTDEEEADTEEQTNADPKESDTEEQTDTVVKESGTDSGESGTEESPDTPSGEQGTEEGTNTDAQKPDSDHAETDMSGPPATDAGEPRTDPSPTSDTGRLYALSRTVPDSARAEKTDEKLSGAKTPETDFAGTGTTEAATADSTEREPSETESAKTEPAEMENTETESTETENTETEPTETAPTEPEEAETTETEPAESETDETETTETEFSETESTEGKPGTSSKMSSRANSARTFITGNDGILTTGNGVASDGLSYNYTVDPGMNHADVTENGSNIIILRYFREVPKDNAGSYKVIHVYYFRDAAGDHREGISPIGERTGQIGHNYTAAGVPLVTDPVNFDVDGKHYTYTHDFRPQYGVLLRDGSPGTGNDPVTGNPLDGYTYEGYLYRPNTSWTSVKATPAGDEVIILRYFREIDASYNIVHEYYYRSKDPDIPGAGGDEEESESTPEASSHTENSFRIKTRSARSGGTLTANDDGYTYTFEGAREIENRRALLNSHHQGEPGDRKPDYASRTYTYYNTGYGELDGAGGYTSIPGKLWAAATEGGQQIIILRYYRGDEVSDTPGPPPETPETTPDNPTPPEESETTPEESESAPEESETATEETETTETTETTTEDPENPGYPTELPDPNDPDSPDRITIWEDGVPKTYLKIWDPDKGEYVYILDEDVPLAPMTGDESIASRWAILFLGALIILSTLLSPRFRHERTG